MFDVIDSALKTVEIMRKHGLPPAIPFDVVADNTLHRYRIEGDPLTDRNGYYCTYTNEGVPGGFIGCWKRGIKVKWPDSQMLKAFPKHLGSTRAYRDEYKQKLEKERIKRLLSSQKAASEARELYKFTSKPDPNHPYLIKKRIPTYSIRQADNDLVVALQDCAGVIWSLQFIEPDGGKQFFPGGAVKGHFVALNGFINLSRLFICEGVATGATLATFNPDVSILVATSANNIKPVAEQVRKYLPSSEITICPDDDRLTPSNPGMSAALEAAKAVGAQINAIQWPDQAPKELTDFNDLYCWLISEGIEHE